ncbi:stAR-related lipid transfer protein 9 isoform X2 [Rhineura floridana]|uniref:stAR-related lipid transfer protein 9 isoform X2 n=1 Tax=Rhineura floridana TaxID=261503 RepID=UPI002AC85F92|nr:stAR-related lipid transfer protein 9 isoform X2 [Rhineura floridana]
MANVKVAVRVRPLSKREHSEGRRIIVEVEDRVAKVRNLKVDNRYEGLWDTREKVVAFGFDYCYWSVDPEDPKYASQEVVFQDLGTSVLSGAFKGYNICLFAYGQTGSGKTYTMMGTPASIGLTPRICEGLFSREDDYSKQSASCRVEVSFLEVYNERVRDLLSQSDHKKPYTLRVREHPEMGPYVQGLSQHVVTDYKQVVGLLEEGIANRITAATQIHDASSRSHAIFTIQYTQAILENNLPSEIASKINLVDLAGSERADPSYCKHRIIEAQNSQMFSSCQSINSIASEVDSSHVDNPSGGSISSHRRQAYIPYRDSILTWLLKDSLGGNSKTIMIATISPASSCYIETMSTLRYASNAKNIINKPRVNEDANVKLIRELREEIDRLKAMLMSFGLRNSSPSWSDDREGNLTELVLQNELKIEQLTKDWTEKWINRKAIMEEYNVDINKKKAGVMIDSSLPHLMAMDYDILSTGVMLYHLREGTTKIGRSDSNQEQDIVLQGQWIERDHCVVDNQHGIVTLRPLQGAHCIVNGHEVTDSVRLSQGALVILGKVHKFRFNHPAEAAILRQRRSISEASSVASCRSLEWLDLDGEYPSLSYSFYRAETESLDSAVHNDFKSSEKRFSSSDQGGAVHEECQPKLKSQGVLHSREIQQQQLYVEELQQQILDGQIKAEQELEHDEAVINQQIKEDQQWLINEKKWLAVQEQQRESAVQTEVKSYAETGVQNVLESETGPSLTEQNKKKLVQLELLRKYSLKKAERHLSRKKVKLHLERIVKKQKLLEAKKNLEELEASCWISEDNSKHSQSLDQDITITYWDCKNSQPESGSGSLQCRTNAFLNRQLPHCSFFLKRYPSQLPTSAHSNGFYKVNPPRKSLSVEYLPRTVKEPHSRDNIHDERDDSFPIHKQVIKNQKSYLGSKGRLDKHSSNTEVISHICKDNKTMEKWDNRPRQTRSKAQISKTSSPDHFKKKSESETGKQAGKAKALGDSNQLTGAHLEKSDTQEASRKIRTDTRKKHKGLLPGNFIKELKKTAICGKPPEQHLSQTENNMKRKSKNKKSLEHHDLLRLATSARSLNNINASTTLCHGEKRWHSAEVLSVGFSKAVPEPLRSWQEDEDIEFSDTDSTYSVDSLSSASAKVLSNKLSHVELAGIKDTVELESSESDDSRMSQDSLSEKVNKTESPDVINLPEVHQQPVKFCKDNNCQPASLLANTSNNTWSMMERSFSLDSLGDADEVSGEDLAEEIKRESFDEVPAEVFWKLQNRRSESIKSNKQHSAEICNETVKKSNDVNLNTHSFYLDASTQSSFNSIYDKSIKDMEICFSGPEFSLDQRSDNAGENLPILPDAWLSYDLKNGKSSPIIAVPSSQDPSEFQVAQLHPVNKSNCWMKKDDLRQSAAELSFVSCYKKLHWVSHESNQNEMLFSSAAPTVPLPETRKQIEIDAPGATLSFSLSTKNVQFGHVSTFPTKHGYSEVASPPKSNYQQPDELSESGPTNKCRQTSSCLKEASRSDSLSQMSEKQNLFVPSVSPEMSKDLDLEHSSLISASSTTPLQKEEIYANTNFKECLFRTIEKGDFSCDSNSNIRDSKVVDLNPIDKPIYTEANGSPCLISLCTTQEKYQGHEHLLSKEGGTSVSDESFYLSDTLKKNTNSVTKVGEEEYTGDKMYLRRYSGSSFDVQKTRYQQVSAKSCIKNKLYQSKIMAFCHDDQFALPIQTSETERVSMQENRDALTESALEVPSFREVEEEKAQDEDWGSENSYEFQTKSLVSYSHSGVKPDHSGSSVSQDVLLTVDPENTMGHSKEKNNVLSFSSQETSSSTSVDLVTDKSVCSNADTNGDKTELSVDSSCDTGDKSTLQSSSNVYYQDTAGVGRCNEKFQGSVTIKDACVTRSSTMGNNVNDPDCISTPNQKLIIHKEVDDSLLFGASLHSGKTNAWHIPASREVKEAPVFHTVFNENDCSGIELHSNQATNYTEKDFGKVLGNDGVVSVIAFQEQDLHVNIESGHLKESVDNKPLSTSEDKGEHISKMINSEELTKLINSVNKLECDILEIKYSQSKSLHNYLRTESQGETVESRMISENDGLIQRPNNDHEKYYKQLSATVIREKIDIQLIDDNKGEPCPRKPAVGPDSIIQSNNINQNKIQGSANQSDCPADKEASSTSTVPGGYSSSTIFTQNTINFLDMCEEPIQVDRTIENVWSSESSVTAITIEYREEDDLNCIIDDKKISTNSETHLIESLIMYPESVPEENKVNGDIICSQRVRKEQCDTTENKEFVNSNLTRLHTDEHVALQQENSPHGFIDSDNGNHVTNAEIPEIYFTASKLEEQEDMHQLSEVCLDTDKEQKSPAALWCHTGVINETLEDDSNDGCAGDNRAVIGQSGTSEVFRQVGNIVNMNASKLLSANSHKNISEHCDINFVGNRHDNDKYVPVSCIPKEKQTIHLITSTTLVATKKLAQSTDTQNMFILKTEKDEGNLEENKGSLEVDVSSNQAETLPENKCSSWFSNNDTILSDAAKGKERLPVILSRNNPELVDDSVPDNQTDSLEHRNQDDGITSVTVKDFSNQPTCYLLPGVSANGENMKDVPTVASNPAMPLSNSINNEVVLQYYETQVDTDLQARVLCTINKGEINESLSDVMPNKCITFPPDHLEQDGEVKGNLISNKTFYCTASEQSPSKDDTFSKLCIAECHESLVLSSTDDPQNKVIPLKRLVSSKSTSHDMDRFQRQYSTREEKKSEQYLNSLNISQKESAMSEKTTMYPSSVLKKNVEEIMPSLPECSQECFNSIISQKELNSLVQYDQTNKCVDSNCIETEYRINSKSKGELECQTETAKILACRISQDFCMGHSSDSIAISEDGANISGYSDEALWENAHYDEDKAADYNMNSYISEYSLSSLNSSAILPKCLLECPIDKYGADAPYFGEGKYLDSEDFNISGSTSGDCSVHQQDRKINNPSDSNKNTQRVVEMYQKENQGQDYLPDCLRNQENNTSLQSENCVDRTEIKLEDRSLLTYQSLEQISNGEALPPAFCSVEDFSTCTVFKNAKTLESPRSSEGFSSSVYRLYNNSLQDAFLTPHLSTPFRIQESQVLCHQGFPDIPHLSSESSLSLSTSHSEAERHDVLYAATSSYPALAIGQMQESHCDSSVILDQQLCAPETTSLPLAKKNGCLPLSDTKSSSQRTSVLDCNEIHKFKSKKFYHERDVCQEPRDTAPMQKSCLEDIGKTLYHTLNSSLDLEEDENTPHLNFPNINVDNYHKVMKSERESLTSEQPNISVINNSMSSKYLSGSSCLALQEEPAPEIIKNENTACSSQNLNRSKEDRQRPGLQSHSLSAPAITVISNFECAPETSKIDFSVHSTSKSLQELNMSVEPPSPTEDDLQRAESLSKLKTDNEVSIKYKLRFQKKSIQGQRFSYCDKKSCRESAQESNSSNPSPVHYPIAVGHTTGNPMDTETGKCSHNVSSVHGHSTSTCKDVMHQMEATGGLLQDNKDAMHFSSSDINPYIHPWQQDGSCKIGWKQYVFGSASDVSSNPPPLSLDNQTVMRCSSVDNGLNSQNSPFHSHLSSYANARMMSSTISSTDDLQGWDVAREGFESTHSDESGKHNTNVSRDEFVTKSRKCISTGENHSQQSGNTSMQVDEIVLLYPSESDTSFNKPQGLLTCEQETQTEAPARHKRQKRHQRSYTDISARNPGPGSNTFQQPSSWSSMQNLSMHLSQLLHNTSELLGNLSLQTVKDDEQSDHKAIDEETSRTTMTDSCTQTTEDIGVQTDILGHLQNKDKESQISTNLESEPMKSREVNVVVKLVHTDTAALTKERISEDMGRILQNMPDIRSHDTYNAEDSVMPQPTLNKNASPSSEVPKMPLNAPPVLALGNSKISPVASSFDSRYESSSVVVSSPVSNISLSPACYSQDKEPFGKTGIVETRDNSLLVDRASSPILTLSASPVSQQLISDKIACSFKGYAGQQKGTTGLETSFRKKGLGPQYDLHSWESRVDSSSQTEVDSESTTYRESKHMRKMPENGLDKNTTRELSGIGPSKQNHRFTIDTHTAVHTKRLYHSSSTLELSSHGKYSVDDHKETVPVECSFHQIQATKRARNFSGGFRYESPTRNSEYSPTKKSFQRSLNEHHISSSLKSDDAPECVLDSFSPQYHQTWRNQNHCPFPMSEMSDIQGEDEDDGDAGSDTESECNTEILLSENTSLVKTHRLRSYSLRDLPLHNKFSNWCGVKGGPHSSLTSLTRSAGDNHSQAERKTGNTRESETEERSLLSERRAKEIERLRRERAQVMFGIHLDVNQHPLSMELTEAKLNYGIGETDAQLRILQSGGVEDMTSVPVKQRLYERHRKSIEVLRKEREERFHCFRRSRSLSPQKHLSLFKTVDTNQRDLDLPSRRCEYLQQLRRDVVENTRIQEPKMRIQHPSEIELLLRDYQRAREETKTEIARARDKLRERAEQEKRRIREQILSQLQKEETKLKTLVSTSTLRTDSTLSLSSGPTSGYNSSNTATYATSILGKQECRTFPEDVEHTREDMRGRSFVRNHQLYILEQLQKGSTSETFPMTSSMERSSIQSPLACSHKYSHSLVVSPSTFPSSSVKGYEDLSKHVLATATAEVMAGCSNDLRNLYNGEATAGWKYQCVEKDVLVYYKAFSSSATKHGFLGAGMIKRPLSTVLCMLKDPSKRHLYDKTITTAQVHKKLTSNIELVYVVSDVSLCYQKQPRDFCCITVEAKEENICILAIQSVYEESMPRPCKEMVRGEILPSAWILEPDTVKGKDITKVIYMVQVDLGTPAIPARLLSSFAKRQPLVIARLAHFLAG